MYKDFITKYFLAIAIIIAIIFYAGGYLSARISNSSSHNVQTSSQPIQQSSQTVSDKQQVKLIDDSLQPINKTVTTGVNEYDGLKTNINVLGICTFKNIYGHYNKNTAQGKYLVVKLTVTNTDKNLISAFDRYTGLSCIFVRGNQEYSYESGLIEVKDCFYNVSINPGNSYTGYLVFDVPQDVSNGTLFFGTALRLSPNHGIDISF